jgi:hypothetical protein
MSNKMITMPQTQLSTLSNLLDDSFWEQTILNFAKILFVSAALSLTATSSAQANSCKQTFETAANLTEEAKAASGSENWSRAYDMYQRSASKWDDAASECSGQNRERARNNAAIARRNTSATQANANRVKCKPYSEPAFVTFQGANQRFDAREWKEAADMFQKAEQQYQRAAQQCDGDSAESARNNAEKSGNNRQKALANIDIDLRNAKKAECRSIRDSMESAQASGRSSEKERKYKEAVESYTAVENEVKKLEKLCRDVYGEASLAKFVETANAAKSNKQAVLANIKYAYECSAPEDKFTELLDNILPASSAKLKYNNVINDLDKQLKIMEKNCQNEEKTSAIALRQAFPLFRNEQKCFQKIASFDKASNFSKDQFLGELKTLCKSKISELFTIKVEASFAKDKATVIDKKE